MRNNTKRLDEAARNLGADESDVSPGRVMDKLNRKRKPWFKPEKK